jgi:hypothetical protein
VSEPNVDQGYNVSLSGNVQAGQLVFTYVLGGGLGYNCGPPLGYPSLGILSATCLKSIQGVQTLDGTLTLTPGSNMTIVPDPNTHTLYVIAGGPQAGTVEP